MDVNQTAPDLPIFLLIVEATCLAGGPIMSDAFPSCCLVAFVQRADSSRSLQMCKIEIALYTTGLGDSQSQKNWGSLVLVSFGTHN